MDRTGKQIYRIGFVVGESGTVAFTLNDTEEELTIPEGETSFVKLLTEGKRPVFLLLPYAFLQSESDGFLHHLDTLSRQW